MFVREPVLRCETVESLEISRKVDSVYRQGVITDRQIRNWFSELRSGETCLHDETSLRCSLDFDDEVMTLLVGSNPWQSDRKLTTMLKRVAIYIMATQRNDNKSNQHE